MKSVNCEKVIHFFLTRRDIRQNLDFHKVIHFFTAYYCDYYYLLNIIVIFIRSCHESHLQQIGPYRCPGPCPAGCPDKVTSNTNNGIFISAAGGNILIQANDYTIGIKTSCPADIEEEGVTVIAAPQLQSTIRMMPAGDVVMEKGDHENLVSFKSGTYLSKFPTREQVEFPDVQEMDHRNHCLVKCRDFADMVSLVSFAAANDKQKPIFPVSCLK